MGTLGNIVIMDDKHVARSEFFHNMSYSQDGLGKEVVLRLMRTSTLHDFFDELDDFSLSQNLPGKVGGDVSNLAPVNLSDWKYVLMEYVYIKNLSCEVQTIIDVNGDELDVQPNQIMIFHKGVLEPYAVDTAIKGGTDIDCDTFTNLLKALNECTTEKQVKELALSVGVEDPILAGLYQESISVKLKELEEKKDA